jgi:hypothetical protein
MRRTAFGTRYPGATGGDRHRTDGDERSKTSTQDDFEETPP